MEKETARELIILHEIGKGGELTQRYLSRRLGVAVGLANALVKRLVKKGYVKAVTLPRNRIRYLLTPRGMAEKTRLTVDYLKYSVHFYRDTRRRIEEVFTLACAQGVRRVAFYGAGDVGEIAYLVARSVGLEIAVVVDDAKVGKPFFEHCIAAPECLDRTCWQRVIITSFNSEPMIREHLREQGVSEELVMPLLYLAEPLGEVLAAPEPVGGSLPAGDREAAVAPSSNAPDRGREELRSTRDSGVEPPGE